MARNIEIKARIEGIESVLKRILPLAESGPMEISQDDTFFPCPNGRLKLREFSEFKGELIFYRRSDVAGPKESFYLIASTACPASLREVLALAYGLGGRVRKQRTLFMIGRTRLHLDRVEDLGDFLELEVVLSEGEPAESGMAEARTLLKQLGVSLNQLVEGAYVDMLSPVPPGALCFDLKACVLGND